MKENKIYEDESTEVEGIILPSREEMQAFYAHQREMENKIYALTEEEINKICNMGFYNNTIMGYMIYAMKVKGFSREDIDRAICGMWRAFDDINAKQAAEVYIEF